MQESNLSPFVITKRLMAYTQHPQEFAYDFDQIVNEVCLTLFEAPRANKLALVTQRLASRSNHHGSNCSERGSSGDSTPVPSIRLHPSSSGAVTISPWSFTINAVESLKPNLK